MSNLLTEIDQISPSAPLSPQIYEPCSPQFAPKSPVANQPVIFPDPRSPLIYEPCSPQFAPKSPDANQAFPGLSVGSNFLPLAQISPSKVLPTISAKTNPLKAQRYNHSLFLVTSVISITDHCHLNWIRHRSV